MRQDWYRYIYTTMLGLKVSSDNWDIFMQINIL